MATFENRDGKWRAKVRRKGFPSESATFDTKGQARAWAQEREVELRNARRGKIIERTVAQGLERYRTQVAPTHQGAHWEVVRCKKLERTLAFRARFISEVRPSDIADWRDRALNGDEGTKALAPASVRREWVILRSMFELARKEWGWAEFNPMDDVKRPAKPGDRRQRWTNDEIERVVLALGYQRWDEPASVSQRVATAFLFALETAMREGEICSLAWQNVHIEHLYVRLPRTKNGSERDVPLTSTAVRILKIYESMQHDDTVFGLVPSQVDSLFRKSKARAGIAHLHFHDTRANAIERLATKLEILDLARAVGHRDLKSLMIYYRRSVTEIASTLG